MNASPKVLKKETYFFISFMICITLLLSGCQSTTSTSVATEITTTTEPIQPSSIPISPTEPVKQANTPTSPPESVTLTVWNHPIFEDLELERALWDELDRAFEAAHPGVKVDMVWLSWDDAWTKRVEAMDSGVTPDISVLGSEMPLTFASWDRVEPIDDVIESIGGADALYYQDYCKMNGHYYCAIQTVAADLLFYRKDILKEAGYDQPPKTWDELVQISQKINKPDTDFYALGLDLSQNIPLQQQHWALRWSNGGHMLDKDCNVDIDTPENAATLQFYYDLYYTYKVLPPAVTGLTKLGMTGSPLTDWYGAGKIGMFFGWAGNAITIADKYPDIYANTGFAPWPAGASGHTGTFAREDALMVHNQSKNIPLAKEYVKFYLQSTDWLAKYAEGAHAPCVLTQGCHPSTENQEWYQVALQIMPYGVRAGWECGGNAYNGTAEFSSYDALMVQDVVVSKKPIDEVLKDYQAKYEDIYAGK